MSSLVLNWAGSFAGWNPVTLLRKPVSEVVTSLISQGSQSNILDQYNILFLHGLFVELHTLCITMVSSGLTTRLSYVARLSTRIGKLDRSPWRIPLSMGVLTRHDKSHSCLFFCLRASGCHPHSLTLYFFCAQAKGMPFCLVKSIILKSCHRAEIHLTVNQWWFLKHPAYLTMWLEERILDSLNTADTVSRSPPTLKIDMKYNRVLLTYKTQISWLFFLIFLIQFQSDLDCLSTLTKIDSHTVGKNL